MSKGLTIIDKDYLRWVKELGQRYRASRIKAAVRVNEELIKFYWSLGRDIVGMQAENRYGGRFFATLSSDLRREMPGAEGFSESNIRYAKRFYQLYANIPQLVEESPSVVSHTDTLVGDQMKKEIFPQVVEQTVSQIAQQDGERPTLFIFGRGQAIAPTLMKEGRG